MNREALEKMLANGTDNLMLRYSLGSICLKEKQAGQAVEHLKAGLAFDQEHSASWKLLGKTLVENGQRDEARIAYEKGIEVANKKGDIQAVKEMTVFLKRLNKD